MSGTHDTFGHLEGDLMLIEVAHVLKESFREADIIARIGGDEFVVLQVAAADVSMEPITSRLRQNLEIKNSSINRNFSLSLSIGIVRYDPDSPCTLDELLSQADKMMYEQKKIRSDNPH
jgi:diguanylate cyclase (GGDEF)-like protein